MKVKKIEWLSKPGYFGGFEFTEYWNHNTRYKIIHNVNFCNLFYDTESRPILKFITLQEAKDCVQAKWDEYIRSHIDES